MKLSKPQIKAGAAEYIKQNFNKTQTMLALKPHLSYNAASTCANDYLVKSGIEKKAIEILKKHGKLSLDSAFSKLEESLEAKKPVYYMGEKIDNINDNPVRLDATKFLIEKVHGVGKEEKEINYNDNRSINVSSEIINSVTKELKELTVNTTNLLDKLNSSREI